MIQSRKIKSGTLLYKCNIYNISYILSKLICSLTIILKNYFNIEMHIKLETR